MIWWYTFRLIVTLINLRTQRKVQGEIFVSLTTFLCQKNKKEFSKKGEISTTVQIVNEFLQKKKGNESSSWCQVFRWKSTFFKTLFFAKILVCHFHFQRKKKRFLELCEVNNFLFLSLFFCMSWNDNTPSWEQSWELKSRE